MNPHVHVLIVREEQPWQKLRGDIRLVRNIWPQTALMGCMGTRKQHAVGHYENRLQYRGLSVLLY